MAKSGPPPGHRQRRFTQHTATRPSTRATGVLADAGRFDALPVEIQKFIDEYLVDLHVGAAAERSGIANMTAWRLMERRDIQDAIKERRGILDGDRALSGAKFVLNKLWDVATGDPRKLIAIHKVPCRYCHGLNGHYQFTRVEMDRLIQAHEYGACGYPLDALWPRDGHVVAYYHAGARGIGFDAQGGDGYTTTRDPNPNCNECAGDGKTLIVNSDTRKISNGAATLYRGVSWSNSRMEIKMANQDAAIEMLARHYGVAVERRKLLLQKVVDPAELSDEELARAIVEIETMMVIEGESAEVKAGGNEPKRLTNGRLARPK